MKSSLSQNNADGSVEAAPPTFNTPRLLSGRYLHMLWSGSAATREDRLDDDNTATSDEGHVAVTCGVFMSLTTPLNRKYNDCYIGGETLGVISVSQALGETSVGVCSKRDSDTDIVEVFQHSRSPVSAALAALIKHIPLQLGRKAKTSPRDSSLEQENYPKIARKRRHLIGLGRPRQEEVLLSWLTHALVPSDVLPSDAQFVPSDVHDQDKKIAEDPCDSEVGNASPKSVSHVTVKQRKTAHRISLASIPEERSSYWLTRSLRTTRTTGTSAQRDLQLPTSPPDHSRTPPIPTYYPLEAALIAYCPTSANKKIVDIIFYVKCIDKMRRDFLSNAWQIPMTATRKNGYQ
ncbi:hypothetical protein EDB19DRAFT_1904425 [Suillus lakei]|nr:hypothetical protein EDB19DRAFT_1904425 [Suillus lakei]